MYSVNLITDLQMSAVLSVKYSVSSGLVVVPDNSEARASFPVVKFLDLSVPMVTCHTSRIQVIFVTEISRHWSPFLFIFLFPGIISPPCQQISNMIIHFYSNTRWQTEHG